MKIKFLTACLIFLIMIFSATASVTLRQGEIYEIGKKELIIESIKSDKIKVNVEGIKNIINIGEQKEVNGVDILFESVFYVDEPEERTVEVVMSMAFYCGDGNCDTGQNESKENCCEDCGCNPGYLCSDGSCKSEAQVKKEEEEEKARKEDECEKDIDCDDNDPSTDDICRSIPGKPNMCLNLPPICKTDLECDDQNPCTVDRCYNNDCVHAKVPEYIDCLKKQEKVEEEKSEEIASELLKEKEVIEESAENKEGLFSRIIKLFLNLFK